MALVENVRNYKLCLPLKKDLAYQILACSKIYESRIAGSPESKLMNIEIGDVIAFHWYTNERVTAKILQVQEFDSLQSMLQRIADVEDAPEDSTAAKSPKTKASEAEQKK